jgi:type IX secretion system PorP/SprF family membrane protein
MYINAQEFPIYNQYIVDPFIVNSAYAGSYDYAQLSANVYQQNINLKGSPKTYLLSFHTPYQLSKSTKTTYSRYMKKSKIGFGGLLYNDVNGPFHNIGLQLTYSYRLSLNRKGTSFFAFGVSPIFSFFQMNKSYFTVANDPAISDLYNSKIVPDVNVGTLFQFSHFRFGLSAYRVLESNAKLHKEANNETLKTHRAYFINFGYKFIFNEFELEPSVADEIYEYKISELSDRIQVNLLSRYKIVNLGISYRLKSSLTFIGGVNINEFSFNFGYSHYPSMYNLKGIDVSVIYKFNRIIDKRPRRPR